MKKILCALLAVTMVFALCACNNNEGESLDVSLKDLIAAVQQNCGAKTADKLIGIEDADFAAMLKMYLGVEADILKDGAMAISTSTAANEIIILEVKHSSDVDTVKEAYQTHIDNTVMSDQRYFPENVVLLQQAAVYNNGNYVVIAVDESIAMVKNAIDQMFSSPELVPALAEAYYAAGPQDNSYDYESAVPGNETVDYDWFSDAMFIGDSRMAGIMKFAKDGNWLTPGMDISQVGLTVGDIYTQSVFVNGASMTVADAVRQPGKFTKCYILLGINELGWGSSARFIECYEDLVELVKEAHPEAQIYLISNLPLGDKAIEGGDWLTNDNVQRFNGYIQQVAAEEEVYYIDAFNLLQVDGKLPAEGANDGIHIQPDVCKQLVEYLMSHTVAK